MINKLKNVKHALFDKWCKLNTEWRQFQFETYFVVHMIK